MSQNLSSAAVVIGALRVNKLSIELSDSFVIYSFTFDKTVLYICVNRLTYTFKDIM